MFSVSCCTAVSTAAVVGWAIMTGPVSSPVAGHERAPRAASWHLAAAAKVQTVVEHVDAAGAAKLLSENRGTNLVVLDVRSPREFNAGHIAGATNVDFNSNQFPILLEKMDHRKTYLVHCAAGGRSTKSLEWFKKLGFAKVIHLDGGFNAWEEAGKPVTR